MAASTRGEVIGARGELLGARGGCGPDLHYSQGRLWLLEVFGARGGCGAYGGIFSNLYQKSCDFLPLIGALKKRKIPITYRL